MQNLQKKHIIIIGVAISISVGMLIFYAINIYNQNQIEEEITANQNNKIDFSKIERIYPNSTQKAQLTEDNMDDVKDNQSYKKAISSKNPDDCNGIVDSILQEKCISSINDLVFYQRAFDSGDIKLCDPIASTSKKSACISIIKNKK